MGLVHALPRQPLSCLGTGHWLVALLASEQKKALCVCMYVETCANMQQHCVCGCVSLCVCLCVCVICVYVCVALLCCRKARRVHCVWFDKTLALVIPRLIGFEKKTLQKHTDPSRDSTRQPSGEPTRKNRKVTIVEQFVQLCCTCNTL